MDDDGMAGAGAGQLLASASTWRQPTPPPAGPARAAVLDVLVARVVALGPGRARVAIDGPTAAGKTSLGHELAARLVASGRTVARASLDDFKHPWADRHLVDRESGEGYYRNAFDLAAIGRLLLDPAGPGGSGRVALCGIDPLTQVDHSATVVDLPPDGVLVVDGVFALRPELVDRWDLRLWVHVDPAVSLRRGIARDEAQLGGAPAAEDLHRDRYQAAEAIYLAEVDPPARADVVVNNTHLDRPTLQRR